jgi:hypothetical protein
MTPAEFPVEGVVLTHELTLRVPGCHAAYETVKARRCLASLHRSIGAERFAAFSGTLMDICWKSARQCKGPDRIISDETS